MSSSFLLSLVLSSAVLDFLSSAITCSSSGFLGRKETEHSEWVDTRRSGFTSGNFLVSAALGRNGEWLIEY